MSGASKPLQGDWYEVRIQGHLDQRWASWLDGDLSQVDDGTTVLCVRVADQAALHGLLNKLRDIGLPLISVTQGPLGRPASPPSNAAPIQNRSTT